MYYNVTHKPIPKTRSITIRVTDAEYTMIDNFAKKEGIEKTNFVRHAVLDHVIPAISDTEKPVLEVTQ